MKTEGEMRTLLKRLTWMVTLASVGFATVPAIALGAHPAPGASYTGSSGKCTPRQECVFKFRVSSNGRTLRYVKKGKALSSWECQGGGGEAVFGPGKNDYSIPSAQIGANGTFSGSDGAGSRRLRIAGSFTKSGKKATLRFALPKEHCHTAPLTLHKR
jgi:hypothetical protein